MKSNDSDSASDLQNGEMPWSTRRFNFRSATSFSNNKQRTSSTNETSKDNVLSTKSDASLNIIPRNDIMDLDNWMTAPSSKIESSASDLFDQVRRLKKRRVDPHETSLVAPVNTRSRSKMTSSLDRKKMTEEIFTGTPASFFLFTEDAKRDKAATSPKKRKAEDMLESERYSYIPSRRTRSQKARGKMPVSPSKRRQLLIARRQISSRHMNSEINDESSDKQGDDDGDISMGIEDTEERKIMSLNAMMRVAKELIDQELLLSVFGY
ncbi:uncharacterized protein V2V93DRAFT_375907 [Kockiozyma suomiensis]|uniref:uncharacterized protein n=1 Tax=Kockiozyma suomiensis TaxID=1337062 RepID=UPI003342FB71